ncbi:MAG: hypothetical protein RLZZ200_1602 [Pseudomonadota bacterium]
MIQQRLHRLLEGHLDLRGTRLRYRLAGRGPVVLLLHGWALDGTMWQPLQARLASRFRVLVVDRRGYGRTTGHPSIEREVADLRVLCRRLGLRDIAVIGMSQAARVALRLAGSRSLRTSCIVLDGPPGPTRGESDPTREDPPITQYRRLVATQGLGAFRRIWRSHDLMRLHQAGRRTQRLLDRMLRNYPGRDLRVSSPTLSSARPLDLSRIRAAASVLCGAEDQPSRRQQAEALAARLQRGEHAVLPNSGHLTVLDAPLRYERTVTAFLRRHVRR